MTRIQLDIRGFTYTLPINPIEYEAQFSFDYSLDFPIANSNIRFTTANDDRNRIMRWLNLQNKYPYTQLISGLKSAVGISGVRLKVRDLDSQGDANEWSPIFIENVVVKFRNGRGKQNAINHLNYDIEMVYTLR